MSPALLAAKFALGPILLPQAWRVQRTALRLPEPSGPRSGVVGDGEPSLRVLVVGDSSAAGVGVADQAQALALPLAHAIHSRTGQAVGWQLVAKTGVNASEALEMLRGASLLPADVAVVVLGVNDVTSQTSAMRYVSDLSGVWDEVRARTGATWAVFNGLPPMHLMHAVPHPLRWYLGKYSDWLDAAVRDWSRSQGLGYCELRWSTDPSALAQDGYHPGPTLYPQWAQRLAAQVVERPARWA